MAGTGSDTKEVSRPPDARPILVCGLGRLGRHCVATLAAFGLPLRTLDLKEEAGLDDEPPLPSLQRFRGDCRSPDVLRRAGADGCRAVILAASEERVNVAAAVTVRSINPDCRIIVRSGQDNLNRLLGEHLGDFVAFEPAALAAPAFALAGLGEDTLGHFRVADELVRLSSLSVVEDGPWVGRRLHELDASRRRVVAYARGPGSAPVAFGACDPDAVLQAGDTVTLVEVGTEAGQARANRRATAATGPKGPGQDAGPRVAWPVALWRTLPRLARITLLVAAANFTLYVTCAAFYRFHYPEIDTQDALNVAMVLILGGYDNLFGQLRVPFPIPAWLHVWSVLVSVCGTVGIGIVYAFITERVLSARFRLFRPRPPMPRAGHVVVVGEGAIAAAVARFFAQLRRPTVLLTPAEPESDVGPGVVVLTGDPFDSMKRARVATARSVVAVGEDDVANLEAALAARAIDPQPVLVVRSDDARFRQGVVRLLAGTRALGVPALAAEAFAAAALGEHVHGLLHVEDRTMLVVEYRVEAGDSLNTRLISDVAYGYGVVPVLWRRDGVRSAELFPSDDVRLREGDALVVIATIEALRAIEHHAPTEPLRRVEVSAAASSQAAFDGALLISRVSGCEVAAAQRVLAELPAVLPVGLYARPARRLVQELAKLRVSARVLT